jgi:Subtilase family
LGDKIISKITLLSGINKQSKGHGTEVLGVILAQDNDIGGIGITPNVKANVISIWRQLPDAKPNNADAISDALAHLGSGDVLLIELQQEKSLLPVETDIAVFTTINTGIANGIVIIESAGNGGADLDTLKFANARGQQKKFFLKRGNAEIEQDIAFRDSGAIMVGAATSGVPHERIEGTNASNYGGRIDCYAWGNNITTTGNNGNGGTTAYTSNFGATSGAAAIIAGAAIAIQSMALAAGKPRYNARQLRDILSDPATGTSSSNPVLDKIGVMPDLKKIYEKYIMEESIPKPITPIPGTVQTVS